MITHGLNPDGDMKLPGRGIAIQETRLDGSPEWVDELLKSQPDLFATPETGRGTDGLSV